MARTKRLSRNPHLGVFTNRNPLNMRHAKEVAVTEPRRVPEDAPKPHIYAVLQGYQGLHLIRVRGNYPEVWDYWGLYRTKTELIQCLLECPPPPMQRGEVNTLLERLGYPGEDA